MRVSTTDRCPEGYRVGKKANSHSDWLMFLLVVRKKVNDPSNLLPIRFSGKIGRAHV